MTTRIGRKRSECSLFVKCTLCIFITNFACVCKNITRGCCCCCCCESRENKLDKGKNAKGKRTYDNMQKISTTRGLFVRIVCIYNIHITLCILCIRIFGVRKTDIAERERVRDKATAGDGRHCRECEIFRHIGFECSNFECD